MAGYQAIRRPATAQAPQLGPRHGGVVRGYPSAVAEFGSRVVLRTLVLVAFVATTPGCSCGDSHQRDDAGADAPPLDDARTLDAGAPDVGLDAALDAGPPDAPPICELAAPTSDVAGTTPLGSVSFPYAWAGLGNTSKACFGVALHATDSSALSGRPARSLWVWLPRESTEPIVGVHTNVHVTLELDGAMATSELGIVEVTAYTRDPISPAVQATIDVEDPSGWSVHGTIAVPYCDLFRDPCI